MAHFIDIVFDGPPSHQSGRFVEVEDDSGKSIKFGEWVARDDGYWVLRIDRKTVEGFLSGSEFGECEHGIKDGEWCEPCNLEYKAMLASSLLGS